jgi:16S rRNA (adenine1518-N6/adenine1519-N6)-dimethyltransferase
VGAAMNLPPLNISALLRAHGLAPKKSLGQNFLIDPAALERIVEAAEIAPGAAVLEVGPGLGSLTRYLALAAERVVAVELDMGLIPVLEDVLGDFDNVEIVHGDILELDPARLMDQPGYWVVANIPYYITSNLIRHLLEAQHKPARLVLTVQREVAERITAKPGDMSLLALSVQVYGQARVVRRIPAGAFYPPPKVDSSAVRVDLFPQPLVPPEDLDIFFRLAKAGFGQKRKTLRNSLSAGLHLSGSQAAALLEAAEIDPQRRAETLSIEEWKRLTEQYRGTR